MDIPLYHVFDNLDHIKFSGTKDTCTHGSDSLMVEHGLRNKTRLFTETSKLATAVK